ncbi:MAG TPA: hypothetical protein VM890_09235 [Longimicrobium sp.]|nr:hypothetical protein [Longimicrobium sp.]
MPLELLPAYGGSCSPAEYIRLVRSNERNVRSVRIQPPRLGELGFGSLPVEYRTPVSRAPADER